MNARNCRVKLNLSPLDFPPIIGLGEQSDFTQTDIPEHKTDALAKGWENFYWEPMREYFESI